MCLNGTKPGASSLVAFVSLIRPGASLLVAFVSLIGFFSLASFPSAGCLDFCLTWSNRGHLVSFLAFTTTRSFNATVLQKGVGGYFRISVCLFLFAFVLFLFCVVRTGYRKWSFPWIGSGNFTNHFCCSNRQSIVWIGSETFTVFFSLWIGQRRFSLFEMWSTRNLLHPEVST